MTPVVMPAKAGIQCAVTPEFNTGRAAYRIIRRSLSSGRPEAGPVGG
jgi:hypothetical protein